MKKLFLKIAVSLSFVLISLSMAFKSLNTFEPIAVIELFSSQGCSSCPPADKLLSETITTAKNNNSKIFALSFHVDYWNRLGWKDPFSNEKFSDRQNNYSTKMKLRSNYTPQMVVNGSYEFVGSNENTLKKTINTCLNTKAEVEFKNLKVSFNDKNIPTISYELNGNFAGCKINIAIVSDSEITSIKRGENSGITLKNENVVRQFISKEATGNGTVEFALEPLPSKSNMSIIAYVQNANSLKITGASKIKP